jgi:cellobiose phosphorylase
MAARSKTVMNSIFCKWVHFSRKNLSSKCTVDELPLRAELFSADQMKQHGKILAGLQRIKSGRSYRSLLVRLADNESLLLQVYNLLMEDVRTDRRITPAGEWLLDNFYLIEEQIRTAKRHFPKGYSRELPHLLKGPSAGFPRVYEIALEIISHGDGRVDPENLVSFVYSYQSVTTLKLGELWAIPIMLRLALMENLRRVAARIAADRIDRNLAEYWAEQMTEIAAKDPKSLILAIADMARSNPPMVSSFVAELTRRLQGQVPALSLPLTWIEQRLSESGLAIEQLVRAENQQQAADQVSISNSIGSLRFLGAMDWKDFVESMSAVEQILGEDPADVYDKMDFATRDSYRHVVEKIAKKHNLDESDVARNAIQLAQIGAANKGGDNRGAHVGFYLIEEGLAQLKRVVVGRLSPTDAIHKVTRRSPFLLYAGTIVFLSVVFTWIILTKAYSDGMFGWTLGLVGLLTLLCTSHMAVAWVDWVATIIATPRLLPRMDFSKGLPPDLRTLVVVPSMLSSELNVEELIKALEVRYLANQDDYLNFGLLTDFPDALEETLPEDEALLQFAALKIEELNNKYPNPLGDTFFLFHRPRLWNSRDKIWMGYERKRGKLAELNKLLRSKSDTGFSCIIGNPVTLKNVKYVITLDTDTLLVRDSARKLVGTMAHPMNIAQYDEKKQRVVSGYGILQPRVAVSMSGDKRSRYSNMCSSEPGIDPYTRTVSDVYQDVFGEGSFIGKGIYDVDAFESALCGRFPDNRILSHDLLEGCFARAGLLSDVQLYEDYPPRYCSDVKRRYRWIRGDWQIARWIMPRVPGSNSHGLKNPLSMLSRWKVLDNLRRSLVASGLTLMLLLGWLIFPTGCFWTIAVFSIILLPALLASAYNFLKMTSDVSLREHVAEESSALRRRLVNSVFTILSLPYEAYYSLDAVLRTTWRLLITHKNLLQWDPSGDSNGINHCRLIDSYHTMWISPFVGVTTAFAIAAIRPSVLYTALPILVLWIAFPFIAWWVSRPIVHREARLTDNQLLFLSKLSRKTWAFFETFVGKEDNWLPPDNFQEHPSAVVAHRTSPTNMGIALLANLSAYDFGYISAGKLIERSSLALHTMESLERYHGHFYNWYNTQTLNPLYPLYISSVDSGNLAGHLLTLRKGLFELVDEPILGKRWLHGLNDSLEVLADISAAAPEINILAHIAQLKLLLTTECQSLSTTLTSLRIFMTKLIKVATEMLAGITTLNTEPDSQIVWWANAFIDQCRDTIKELTFLTPWIEYMSTHNEFSKFPILNAISTLRELEALETNLLPEIIYQLRESNQNTDNSWLSELQHFVTSASQHARIRISEIEDLTIQCDTMSQMEYGFLYDESRHLLSIGYSVIESLRDSSYYDLLASEARFSSFVAIAQGKLPQESWFALGRLLTIADGKPILLSWSGSMFEYLMPLLVMPTYEHTLLDQSYKAAVARQIEYGKRRSVPWGISESGYNAIDVHLNYQYRAFGVPGLGLKRGLAEDLVIAPYASALALMVAPEEACQNLERLAADGFEARYGFYEAIDYTPSRLPRGQTSVIVRSFMAHHQGMSLLSLAYLLLDRPMQKRFESDSLFQATMLLLQERIPKATAYYARTTKLSEHYMISNITETPIRIFTSPDTPNPELQLLSNGRYHVMVTNSGGGFSRWKNIDVTRWREDRTYDNWGTFCYIRDVTSMEYWSTAYQPTLKRSKHFEAIFSEGRVEFRRRDHDYDIHTEIAVSPEDDIELRRVSITNRARTRRTIDITSYGEVVLAPAAADAIHPAFSNLFVQTEIIPDSKAILCTRRPRSAAEVEPWMLHLMAVHGAEIVEVSYETDREKFIGRGKTPVNPLAVSGGEDDYKAKLSCSDGSVLDPIVAIRYRIILNPEVVATINIVTGIGETREEALTLVDKYQDRRLADRVFDLAWTHGQVLLRQFNVTEADAQLYGVLAGSIIFANASLRADPSVLIKNHRGQSGLWGYAISGDLPIILLRIADPANIDLVRQLVQAHAYWRLKGLAVDLVIWNEDHAGYRQLLHDQIMGLIAAGIESNVADQPGGIFVRSVDQISDEDRILIMTVARAIISDNRGSLSDQIYGRTQQELNIPMLVPTRTNRSEPLPVAPAPRKDLTFFNGLGGFTPDGREYVITTSRAQQTPAPWVNVLANPQFGSVISESGLAFTWSENAHEFRLTPWGNDPVSDSKGEAMYLRDEERGHFWSPTPQPCSGSTPYVTRHGFGYSVFEHTERGIRTELWVYVALDAAIKFSVLKVFNDSERTRRLSATGFVEWVLGDLRHKSSMHIITESDSNNGAILARNPYNTEFPGRVAFFDTDDTNRSVSSDRTEFLGRNGTLSAPAAMSKTRLSGRMGAALDPCAAIQVNFELAAGQEYEVIFRLGLGRDAKEAGRLINQYRGSNAAREVLENVWQHWTHTLGAVNVETPDPSLNVMANGWLLYQTLACRLWARSATYQPGGAYGFRDQLQDVMALIHTRPDQVREHLLMCASRQFKEGDVQHWWHPPTGRGVRTHISDDYLWLPLTTCRYVLSTGDRAVLDEQVQFLTGRPVNADEDSYYDLPLPSNETATLYEHCVRAIKHGLQYGKHGLPLMGTGDWNDGMNLVGEHGKGESIWLGFFIYDVLMCFTEIARMRDEEAFAVLCVDEANKVRSNIEKHGWDGGWYRRAYFDDGTPLGSAENPECKIDSIAQSWAVLSGAGDKERTRVAMASLEEHLVRREAGLVQLLDPPFDKSDMNPGYIKGYVPGVRENGGQYTHAAIWAAMAYAKLGDQQRAWEIFTMINPVNHALTPKATAIYKVEPYVVAADVYAASPHTGRGGWTWYTGSAAWMYRLILESLLGLRLEVDKLYISPCLPSDWEGFKLHYRYMETVFHISVIQTHTESTGMSVLIDGKEQQDRTIPLFDDHLEHWVEVQIPAILKN